MRQIIEVRRVVAHTLTAALVTALTACGGGGSSSSSDPSNGGPVGNDQPTPGDDSDDQAPTITSRSPTINATDFAVAGTIVITFDEPLQDANVNQSSVLVTRNGVQVDGEVEYYETTNQLSFAPDNELEIQTVYGIELAATITDQAGNAFLGANWFFTTGDGFNLGPTSQIVIDECMEDQDKRMLTLVNNARITATICGTDNLPAVDELAWHCLLEDAAQGHSMSMATNDFHQHVSPVDGSDPGDRIAAVGYRARTWGENIAAGYPTSEAVMQAWLDSTGHCRNIMGSGFTEMGAGVAENPVSTYGIYWTQKFGAPQ